MESAGEHCFSCQNWRCSLEIDNSFKWSARKLMHPLKRCELPNFVFKYHYSSLLEAPRKITIALSAELFLCIIFLIGDIETPSSTVVEIQNPSTTAHGLLHDQLGLRADTIPQLPSQPSTSGFGVTTMTTSPKSLCSKKKHTQPPKYLSKFTFGQ